jgi:hypothetical protein
MATIRLPADFKEFLRLLTSTGVEYLVGDGVVIDLISLEDLKKNKAASGRLKDLLDLEQLS